jgi:hypothetical protein
MDFMRMGGGPTSEPLLARSCVRCRHLPYNETVQVKEEFRTIDKTR